MHSKSNIFYCLLSFLFLLIAWPPIQHTGLLLLVAFVPILFMLNRSVEKGEKFKKALALTFLTLFVWNVCEVYWIIVSLLQAGLPWAGALGIALVPYGLDPLCYLLIFYLFMKIRKRYSLNISLICWVGLVYFFEYVKLQWDLKFPWMNLSNGFSETYYLVQWIQYTGAFGITLWVLISNVLFLKFFLNPKSKTLKKVIFGVVLIPVLFSLVLFYLPSPKGKNIDVVVVQPNIDPNAKYGFISKQEQLDILLHLSKEKINDQTSLLVFPETALTDNHDQDRLLSNRGVLMLMDGILVSHPNLTLVSGIETFKRFRQKHSVYSVQLRDRNFYEFYNSVFALRLGNSPSFYNKSELVAGVEVIPFKSIFDYFPTFFQFFGGASTGYTPGTGSKVFEGKDFSFGSIICYETLWGDHIRTMTKKGAGVLLIHTNDGWWGDTKGKDQHLSYARLRAIENGRYIIRSANTGYSAFINSKGEIIKKSNWWKEESMADQVPILTHKNLYVRTGDILMHSITGLLLLLGLGLKRKPNRT